MRLATLHKDGSTVAARLDGALAYLYAGHEDVGSLLRSGLANLTGTAVTDGVPWSKEELAPLILKPGKVICVGLNYRKHIEEMGRPLPEYPTLFGKVPESIIGPRDDIILPPESSQPDFEGELGVVIGRPVRRARGQEAVRAIAGYTVVNDVTMRDWQQSRGTQWFQGKAWEATTPVGPVLVTPDELPPDAMVRTTVDDVEMQAAPVSDLVFDASTLVEYISTIHTLQPGDIIATGTPGGVGHARKPPVYLRPGQRVTTSVDGVGELVNTTRAEVP